MKELLVRYRPKRTLHSVNKGIKTMATGLFQTQHLAKARFKRRATAVPNSIDRIKFDFSTAVARLGFKRRATAVPNSIHKL